MVLSMIDPAPVFTKTGAGEYLDKWREEQKMSRARWGEAKFPEGTMVEPRLNWQLAKCFFQEDIYCFK